MDNSNSETKPAYADLIKYLEVATLVGAGLIGFLRELKRNKDDLDDILDLWELVKKSSA
jgi:hypothetical protein